MKILKAAYAGIWLVGFLGRLPKWGWDFCLHRKYRNSLTQRLGSCLPHINKAGRPLIWIHAVSMGETRAIAPLAKKLSALPQKPLIIISSTTETGHAEAKRSIKEADAWIYLPFDFYPIIARAVNKLKPDLVILSETDLWYQFLSSSRAVGAATALVNGKISARSVSRWKKFSFLGKPLFDLIDLYCVQDQINANRFIDLRVPSKKLNVSGNLKMDGLAKPLDTASLEEWKRELSLTPTDFVLVAGSTHDPEELLLLESWMELRSSFPNLKLVIVPRHPERFEAVYQALKKSFAQVTRFSEKRISDSWDVLLVDAMGILQKFYQIATVAFVGGTYNPNVGGHSLVEPCNFGVPVVFGPYTYTQINFLEAIKLYGAGRALERAELTKALAELLNDSHLRQEMGSSGQKLVAESQGATERTFDQILNLIKDRAPWIQNNS